MVKVVFDIGKVAPMKIISFLENNIIYVYKSS